MDIRLLLSKIIMLIFRTREIGMDSYDNLVTNSLDYVKIDNHNDEQFLGVNKTRQLYEFITELLEEKEPFNLDILLPSLEIILDNDPKLYKIITKSICKELEDTEIKKMIGTLSGEIKTFIREEEALALLSKVTSDIRFNRARIGNFNDYIRDAMAKLEPLTLASSEDEDPAIVRELDFNNKDDITEVFDDVRALTAGEGIYKFAWQKLNRQTQGGIRPGEFCTIGALQHKYKTGFTLSLFAQIATHNEPIMTEEDVGKKPLLVRISTEDGMENNLQFLFQYFKANEGIFFKMKELIKFSSEEMASYVHAKLTATGFSIRMLRIDPSLWSYSDLFSYVLKLESEGYSVKGIVMDYLTMIQTTGCTQGPSGVEIRDLLRRVRNFMSARGIFFITPLQFSPAALALLRNGVPDIQFLKEIAEKSFYSGSSQLAQEIDLELYIHLIPHNGMTYLNVVRGKHRIPTMLENQKDMNILFPFKDRNTPLLEDLDKDDIGLYSLPSGGSFGGMGGDVMSEIFGV